MDAISISCLRFFRDVISILKLPLFGTEFKENSSPKFVINVFFKKLRIYFLNLSRLYLDIVRERKYFTYVRISQHFWVKSRARYLALSF